ncbi:hypothetical protein FRC11_008718 [Ceratobasidium sp. 423]|nr:hypothetical protein FRC11_008718 [Ceratobasidium sp. 423]
MPEIKDKPLAPVPIATQGASDGHHEELPKRRLTVEEMLAAAKAKKATRPGGSTAVATASESASPPPNAEKRKRRANSGQIDAIGQPHAAGSRGTREQLEGQPGSAVQGRRTKRVKGQK